MSYAYKMYPDSRNVTCGKGGLRIKEIRPPSEPDSATGFEVELRGGSAQKRSGPETIRCLSLSGVQRTEAEWRGRIKLLGGVVLDCLRAKGKGRKLPVNNLSWIEETTPN